MMRIINRLSLAGRALILIGLVVVLTTGCVVGAAYWALKDEFDLKAKSDIETNLRALALTYADALKSAQAGSDIKVSLKDGIVDRVDAPGMPDFKSHEIVDKTAALAGGTATVFVHDKASDQFIRRTTNVKKENGDRAVGTQLAPDHPGQAVVRRGEAYKGPAVLFGRKFYTAYQPIFDPQGKTHRFALMSACRSKSTINCWRTASRAWSRSRRSASCSCLALSAWLVRRSLAPLGDVTRTVTQLADGNLDAEIGHTGRGDEIGAIARALAVFRDAAQRHRAIEGEERMKTDSERRRAATVAEMTRKFQQEVAGVLGDVEQTIAALEGDARTMREAAETTRLSAGRAPRKPPNRRATTCRRSRSPRRSSPVRSTRSAGR